MRHPGRFFLWGFIAFPRSHRKHEEGSGNGHLQQVQDSCGPGQDDPTVLVSSLTSPDGREFPVREFVDVILSIALDRHLYQVMYVAPSDNIYWSTSGSLHAKCEIE